MKTKEFPDLQRLRRAVECFEIADHALFISDIKKSLRAQGFRKHYTINWPAIGFIRYKEKASFARPILIRTPEIGTGFLQYPYTLKKTDPILKIAGYDDYNLPKKEHAFRHLELDKAIHFQIFLIGLKKRVAKDNGLKYGGLRDQAWLKKLFLKARAEHKKELEKLSSEGKKTYGTNSK